MDEQSVIKRIAGLAASVAAPWCVSCRAKMKKFGRTTVKHIPRWMCTGCGVTILGSRVRRTRMDNKAQVKQIRIPEKYAHAISLFREGFTSRQVCEIVQICKVTANRARQEAIKDHDIRCRCGKIAGRQGFCWYTFQQSPKRQEFMAKWHSKGV